MARRLLVVSTLSTRATYMLAAYMLAACGGEREASAPRGSPSSSPSSLPSAAPAPSATCTRVLEALAPEPVSASVNGFFWIGASELGVLVGEGDGPTNSCGQGLEPKRNGIALYDLARDSVRMLRGFSAQHAMLRAGSTKELLVAGRGAVGVIDLASGCLRSSSGLAPELSAIDARGRFFVLRSVSPTIEKLSRIDADTLAVSAEVDASVTVEAVDVDSTSESVVTRDRDGHIDVFDQTSKLAARGAITSPRPVVSGPWVRPNHAQALFGYHVPCAKWLPAGKDAGGKPFSPKCESGNEQGLVLIDLNARVEVSHVVLEDRVTRGSWSPDGSVFTPDTLGGRAWAWNVDANKMQNARISGASGAIQLAADSDTFAAAALSSVDVGSLASGKTRWTKSLPTRPTASPPLPFGGDGCAPFK